MPKALSTFSSFLFADETRNWQTLCAGAAAVCAPSSRGLPTQVPFYMSLSDFFIGKPGPGSVSEAVAMRLPVIVERNAWTLPQERYNADWVVEKQVGLVVRGPHQIPAAVKKLLARGNLARFRTNAAAIRNRAVYEIPGILRKIVEGRPQNQLPKPEKAPNQRSAQIST